MRVCCCCVFACARVCCDCLMCLCGSCVSVPNGVLGFDCCIIVCGCVWVLFNACDVWFMLGCRVFVVVLLGFVWLCLCVRLYVC